MSLTVEAELGTENSEICFAAPLCPDRVPRDEDSDDHFREALSDETYVLRLISAA